jgi:hypothetical protein
MKTKRIIFPITLLCLIISACVEIDSEIAMNAAYSGDKLAVIGYLCNKGVVVNLQKTLPVEHNGTESAIVDNANVTLHISDEPTFLVGLYSNDNLNYFTPNDFTPERGKCYYISVSSPGFDEIRSTSQSMMDELKVDTVEIGITILNNWMEDTTKFALFGKPRTADLEMKIEDNRLSVTNEAFRYFTWFKSCLLKYSGGKGEKSLNPTFYYELGLGGYSLREPSSEISCFYHVDDQVETGDSIDYKNKRWPVVERIDSVLLQFRYLSPDFIEYLQNINYYMENRTSPFSALVNKAPSNMSNGIGFFGNAYIVESVVRIPPYPHDSINIYQPE